MRIVFCLSYLNLIKTLAIIDGQNHFLIITHNPKIEQFFIELYQKENIFLIQSLWPRLNKRFLINLVKTILLKVKYRYHFRKIKKCEIFIGFHGNAFMESWLTKVFSRDNTIYRFGLLKLSGQKSSYRIDRINSFLIKLILKTETDPITDGGKTNYLISENYFNSLGVKNLLIEPRFPVELKDKLISKYRLNSNMILFFPIAGWIKKGVVERASYLTFVESLIEVVGQNSILIKPHPRHPNLIGTENKLKSLPDYLPGNIILESFEIIIGFHSASLFEAANRGKIAISLLNIQNLKSERLIENVDLVNNSIEYLKNNLLEGNSIFYPNNFEELRQIIENAG